MDWDVLLEVSTLETDELDTLLVVLDVDPDTVVLVPVELLFEVDWLVFEGVVSIAVVELERVDDTTVELCCENADTDVG